MVREPAWNQSWFAGAAGSGANWHAHGWSQADWAAWMAWNQGWFSGAAGSGAAASSSAWAPEGAEEHPKQD